jgi:outer membrane lipoprotein SlyB
MRKYVQTAVLACSVAAGLYAQADRVPSGTEIEVRTNEAIDAKSPSDSRIYTAVVDRDVTDRSGRVAIPRGSNAELILRDSSSDQVVLDLESIDVNGQRYTVNSTPESVTADSSRDREGVGANKRTGKYVGGGAVIGSIIGAIAGGGKGAAIGAATGAGAGAVGQTVTRGGKVRVPAETLLTFRLDRGLTVGTADNGYTRDGRHYHRSGRESYRGRSNN